MAGVLGAAEDVGSAVGEGRLDCDGVGVELDDAADDGVLIVELGPEGSTVTLVTLSGVVVLVSGEVVVTGGTLVGA
ncbi:MAG: hypothetical protein ACXVGI_09800 [Mycobacteriaceae bacterium]